MSEKRLGDRTFGLALAAVFGLIALIGWLAWERFPTWAIAISGSLLTLALIAPGLLMPLNRIWSWAGHRIGSLSNWVLLGGFFYLVILPFGLPARLLGRGSIQKRPDPGAASYWTPVTRQATSETYPDMF